MRNLFICVLFATFSLVTHAQSTSDILKQQAAQGVKEGAKEGTTVATEKAADKLSDKIMSKIFDKKKKSNPDNTATNSHQSGGSASGSATTDNNSKQENKDAPQVLRPIASSILFRVIKFLLMMISQKMRSGIFLQHGIQIQAAK